MHIPTTLKHKPVLVAEDYGRIDGRTAYGSDARASPWAWPVERPGQGGHLRQGVAAHREKWSRQSEELPSTGAGSGDSGCRAQLYFQEEAYRFPRGYDPEHPQVDRIGCRGTP